MHNLLFISNTPQAEQLKDFLVSLLKARIDLVTDFDLGLKDVFEKRPTVVVIQDEIAGVTGESVARHIQMLLGQDTPRFVVLHGGSAAAKTIPGLFEHLLDLNQEPGRLNEQLLSALRSLLGDQWQQLVKPEQTAAAMARQVAIPAEDRAEAERLVEDLISDVRKSGVAPRQETAEAVTAAAPGPAAVAAAGEDTTDEMAGLLLKAARELKRPAEATPPSAETTPEVTRQVTAVVEKRLGQKAEATPQGRAGADPATAVQPAAAHTPEQSRVAPPAQQPAPQGAAAEQPRPDSGSSRPVPPSPADFRIDGAKGEAEQIPEDLLLAFEQNYRSHSRPWKKIAVVGVVAVLAGGSWYLLSQWSNALTKRKPLGHVAATAKPKPGTPPPVAAPPAPPASPAPTPAAPAPAATPKPAAPVPSTPASPTASLPQPKAVPNVPALPSFVPTSGKDRSFSAKKPGWERYVNTQRDVRIFRSGDKIKAVQVMAGKGRTLDESLLASALKEVAGDEAYTLGARTTRKGYQGYLIQQGTVGRVGDLIVYRKKGTDAIVAFVVSLN